MPGVDSMQIQFMQVLNNNNHWQQNFLVLKKPRFMFIQAITILVFVLDSPKKWIETAFTESVSTRCLPWLAENTFADRTDQMFIRLINKVYKDTHRLSVQNTFTHPNCTIVFKLSFRMFQIIYFITPKGFFFVKRRFWIGTNTLFPAHDWRARVTRASVTLPIGQA